MLSNFNNSLKNNRLDLNNKNYSDTKMSDDKDSASKLKLSGDIFGNQETLSSAGGLELFQKASQGAKKEKDSKPVQSQETTTSQPAGYSCDEVFNAFAHDPERWREIMNDVIDKSDLSAAEKAKRKQSSDKFVNAANLKHCGLTYREATRLYNSIRQKYSGYLAAYVSDGRMEIGRDKATGAPIYGAEKRKLDDDRLVEVIRKYGSPEEASDFLRAKSALEAFEKDKAEGKV